MRDRFDKMFRYDGWANALAYSSLREQGDAGPAGRRAFGHVIGAQVTWLARLQEDEHPGLGVWPDLTADQMGRYVQDLPRQWSQYIAEVEDGEWRDEIVYRNSAGSEFTTPVVEILDHVLLHSAYHRGQLATLLREVGLTPAVTDYIAYVRSRPA